MNQTQNPQISHLSLIACVSRDGGLGNQGQLIWRIPADMKFFKQTTMDHIVVMGRKTFESIGNPLLGRHNVVLSAHGEILPGADWCRSRSELDHFLASQPGEKFIIGGASLYRMYIDQADKLYLTEVDAKRPADTYFPSFDRAKYLREVLQSGQQDGINYNIVEYTKL